MSSATLTPAYDAIRPVVSTVYRPFGSLRFGLAVLVVVQHFQHLLPVQQRGVFDTSGFGMIAVAIFFVISGFVVAEANAVFYNGRPGAFFGNRLIRLLPPYLAALAVSVITQSALWRFGSLQLWDYPSAGPPVTVPHFLAGIFGLVPGLQKLRGGDDFEFIPFTWSLRMEMAFYGAATAALVAASWSARPKPIIGGCLATGLVASVVWLVQDRPGLMSCAPMFLLGVALCLSVRHGGWLRGLLVCVALSLAALGFRSWVQHGHPSAAVQAPLLAGLLLLFIVLAESGSGTWQRVDRFLGDLSYPLYLNHYVIGIAITGLSVRRGPGVFAAGLGMSLCVAAAMAWLVDGRLTALRNRLRHARL